MTSPEIENILKKHENLRPLMPSDASIEVERCFHDSVNTFSRWKGRNPSTLLKFCQKEDKSQPLICEREELASKLGKVLEIAIVDSWAIPTIGFRPDDLPNNPDIITDRCVAMTELAAKTIGQSRDGASQIVKQDASQVADIFAFMHWIGDEDRGLDDILIQDGRFVLIDNGLCGPGTDPTIRGVHPDKRSFARNPSAAIKMCWNTKPSFVAFVLRDTKVSSLKLRSPNVIQRINQLNDDAILTIVRSTKMPEWIAESLIHRKELLAASYHEWLSKATVVCAA